ncbi:MAG: aldo/keto reductase family protein [Planctomycetota bacterium]|nr:aldo/keto reductase family protein [Planctomycetota bacterium]
MNYRKMGRSGLKLSSVSLGGWITFGGTVDEDAARAIVRTAVDGGVNYLDFADVYALGKAEEVMGRMLGDYRREDLVLSSKCFWPMGKGPNDRGLSRKHIVESVEASLKRFGTDYIDLYFCHREDPDTDLEETARALDDLVSAGKLLYWGTSVWSAGRLKEAAEVCDRRNLVGASVEQPPYSLMDRGIEAEVLPEVREQGMGVVCWSPLAGGLLTGKYDSGEVPAGSRADVTSWLDGQLTPKNLERLRAFSALAAELGLQPSQLALAWVLAQDGITSVITGATDPAQVTMNLKAAEVELEPAVLMRLGELFPV